MKLQEQFHSAHSLGNKKIMSEEYPKRFEKVAQDLPDVERLYLPESFRDELVASTPESPLSRMIDALNNAVVSEEQQDRYRGAVEAFLFDRGSAAKISVSYGFDQQEYYFGPYIKFAQTAPPIPDFLRHSLYKPHLQREGKCQVSDEAINGDDVLLDVLRAEHTRGIANEQPSELEKPEDQLSKLEKLFVRLNQFTYALHEPIHINQLLGPGDHWNRIKERLPRNPGLINPEKEREYITQMPQSEKLREHAQHARIANDSPFIANEDSQGSHITDEEDVVQSLVANNEATMDILADNASGAFLRNHPEIMLWTHNTLSFCIEALRSLRGSLLASQATPENTGEENTEKFRQQQLLETFLRITTAIDFIERFYFAAFPSSEDAKEYLAANDKPVLGRHLTGMIANPPPFDYLELINTENDIKKLFHRMSDVTLRSTPPTLYHYPSGKKFLENGPIKKRESVAPMTKEGADLGAMIFARMIQSGLPNEEIKNEFKNLDNALFLNDHERIEHAREQWNQRFNIDLSENDMREMYGVGNYVYFNTVDNAPYAYQREFRRRTMDRLGKTHPDALSALVRQCFFELAVTREQTMLFTQLGIKEKRIPWHIRPWNDIIQETALSVFDLNVTTLHEKELQTLHALYDQVAKEDSGDIDYEGIIRSLADMRVVQMDAY